MTNGYGEDEMIDRSGNSDIVEQDNGSVALPPAPRIMPESLVQIAWRGRWIILLVTVAALVVGFVYISKATPIYTSTSRIYVEQSGPRIINELEEGVMTQSKNYLYTQAEILRSTPVLGVAVELSGIRQLRTFTNVSNPVAYLRKSLEATVGAKDDIINVSIDSPYSAEAAQIVNAVVNSYIDFHTKTKRTTSAEVLKILQAEKTKRGRELSENLKALMDYKQENEALAFETGSGNIILDELRRISDALTAARLESVRSGSNYELAKTMVNDPVMLRQFMKAQQASGVYISTGDKKAQLESELDQLQRRHADCLHQLSAGHPAIEALKEEIGHVRKQIAELDKELAQSQVAVAQKQYMAAKTEEAKIAEYYEELRKETLELNQQIAQYTILQSEYEQTRKLCDILDDRIKELNVTEDVGALNISILEAANPSIKPSKPQKAKVMSMALILGLMLGGGFAFLRSWLDQRFRSADEVSSVLGLPVLGVVPSMSRRETLTARGQKVHLDSTSAAAEACRTIRTAVFFGLPKGRAKTVLVTSPAPEDGKTTLVSNLAIAMAQAGQRVLVLDADFRRPMQHRIFESRKEPGLSGIVAGQVTLEEAIRYSSIEGLDVLACGRDVPNPSEILNSEVFTDVISELSSRYDRIIIDAPPVMPVTDACILAAICDVTLLVLRAEQSTRKTSQQACDKLLSVSARILGVVVNDVSRKRGRYGYYYGYGYYGHYKYEHGRKKQEKEKDGRKKTPAVVAASSENGVGIG